MWGDYGYIEDDRKRGYDLRLIWRFARYAKPYRGLLILTCVLILAATAADLVVPYLTKLAIDRHIIAAHRLVDFSRNEREAERILGKHRDRLRPAGAAGSFFIADEALKDLPPEDLAALGETGILEAESYCLADAGDPAVMDVVRRNPGLFKIYDGLAAGRAPELVGLPPGDLMALRGRDLRGLADLALFACLVMVLGYLFELGNTILLEYVGQRLAHDLRQALAAHVFRQSMSFHDRSVTGVLVARVTNDIQNLSEMIKSVAVTFFQDVFILTGIVAVMLYLNLRLALVTFILLPPIFLVSGVFRRLARDAFRELRVKVAEINAFIGEMVGGLRVIQAFRREAVNRRRFAEINHGNYLAGMRQIHVFALFMPTVELIGSITLALIIWYGGLNVLSETITLGVVVAFIGYSRKFFQPIRDLAEKFNILQSAMASLERVFGLLDRDESLPEPEHPEPLPPGTGRVEFDRVHFAYAKGPPVLKDVSFVLEPGRTLAIVGATGAGKTSIINLLLRFYDVTSGRVLVDGADVRDLSLAEHRRRIGLVMQDVFIFDGSVTENVALSRNGAPRERVRAAAAAVGADAFIRALPGGYEERLLEGGKNLSVGQRQLLAFARVLVQDPRILVLDEATAFVDSESELLIEEALRKLTAGRTSIVIAHRLSTIRRADAILVLHQGRAVEMGAHAELMERRGVYYRLHQLQFIGNRPASGAVSGTEG